MKSILPIDIDITESNIAENEGIDGTIYPYSVTEGYAKGIKRYYDKRLWETYTEIKPLATYSWNDLDPLDKVALRLEDQVVIDATSVPIANAVTIVYVYSNSTYYVAKTTGNVDFTAEDIVNSANFTALTDSPPLWRYEQNLPAEESIYWKDLGATNRNKCVDQAINTYSLKEGEINLKFIADDIDLVALLNIECETAQIIVTDTVLLTVLKDETVDVLNLTYANRREWMRYKPQYKKTVRFDLDFFTRNPIEINIILTGIDTTSQVKLGEVLAGKKSENGLTLDGVPIDIASARKIIENLDTGEVILEKEDVIKSYFLYNFSLLIDTSSFDTKTELCAKILAQRILVFAENDDDVQFESMAVYGFVRKASPTLTSNRTKSDISMQVQSFVLNK